MKIVAKEVTQEFYGKTIVDVSEIDIVQIWQSGDVIHVQRDKIQELIDILEQEKL